MSKMSLNETLRILFWLNNEIRKLIVRHDSNLVVGGTQNFAHGKNREKVPWYRVNRGAFLLACYSSQI